MPAYLFDSGYDSLANQRENYDALNTRIQQENARQAQADYQFAAQQQMAQQRQAEEDARQRAGLYYQSVQDAQRQSNLDRDVANQTYQFGVAEKDRQAQETERKREFDVEAGTSKLKDALNDVQSGVIEDPAQITALHPELTPVQVSQVNAAWDAKNRQDMVNYKLAAGLTGPLNAQLQAKLALKKKADENAAIDEADADAVISANAKMRGLNSVQFNPDTGLFETVIDKPKTREDFLNPQTPPPVVPRIPAPKVVPAQPTGGLWAGFKRNVVSPVMSSVMPAATVRVRAPDGRTGTIPAARLPAYLANGYIQIQ